MRSDLEDIEYSTDNSSVIGGADGVFADDSGSVYSMVMRLVKKANAM